MPLKLKSILTTITGILLFICSANLQLPPVGQEVTNKSKSMCALMTDVALDFTSTGSPNESSLFEQFRAEVDCVRRTYWTLLQIDENRTDEVPETDVVQAQVRALLCMRDDAWSQAVSEGWAIGVKIGTASRQLMIFQIDDCSSAE